VQITVAGVGVSNAPAIGGVSPTPLTFFPDSAPDTFLVQNTGGSSLVLENISIGGANPASFQFFAANSGQSNCFSGEPLAPLSYCFLGIGLAPGATAPASATLVILSNDPASPATDVPLTIIPLP
jgi:hypothetical protein